MGGGEPSLVRRLFGSRGRSPDLDLLLQSPLFDAEWYGLVADVEGDREQLVRHYLSHPAGERMSPHPLFDGDWFLRHFSGEVDGDDPFLVYLRNRAWATATHPLFAAAHYRRTVPAAKRHPHGPIGHYVEVGAASGAVGHRWLRGHGTAPALDVRAFVLDSRRKWAERQQRSTCDRAPEGMTPDWETEESRERDPALTSVVISTRSDWESTARAVRRALEGAGAHAVQVVVVARGSDALTSVMLDALAVRNQGVQIVHQPIDHGAARSAAAAVPHLRGSTVLLTDPHIVLDPGWLAPLVASLDDDVRGVQPLLLRSDRTIRCAGLAFSEDGAGHEFLGGFPVEDAAGVEALAFQALSGACLLVRTADFAAVRGFDAAVPAVARDVDLCLRLAGQRPGGFTVRPDATAVQHGDSTPTASLRPPVAGVVPDDTALWHNRGFAVGEGSPGRLERLRPVVTEGAPRLRWAIKNPATTGPYGDRWGDTHFAEAVASALRSLGQEVMVDRRDAFHRPTGRHDDVNLVLRGLTPFLAAPRTGADGGPVTLGWVISHPDEVTPDEVRTWDRALAASTHWAAEKSQEWRIEVEPLLQASDPSRFHPDLAVPDTGHPVLFVGNSRQQYRPMVRDAVEQGLPLMVYGTEWEGIIPDEFLAGTYLPNEQVGAAYGAAGLVLNDHWEDMRVAGFVSNRLFDAVASGARVISDDVSGLGDLFGRSVQVVRTPRELAELSSLHDLDSRFGDAAERRAVAQRVHAEHSFTARARRLLEVALEERSARGPIT